MIPPELLKDGTVSVADAAHFTGLGRTKLYELMTRGELVYLKVGGRRLIPRTALIGLLARGTVGVITEPNSSER